MAWFDRLFLYYRTIKSAGTSKPGRSNLNFINCTVADNSATDSTDVTPIGGGGSTPTGTGLYHIAAGVADAAASIGSPGQMMMTNAAGDNTPWATMSGDATIDGDGVITIPVGGDLAGTPSTAVVAVGNNLSGTAPTAIVIKINYVNIDRPTSGENQVGNGLYLSNTGLGVERAIWQPLNLAGGSGWVSGVLPTANQAAQAMSGDVSGTTATSQVDKVHGVTFPGSGAGLTTGNAPYASAGSTVAYGALNLAGGSGWVTGALPLANQAAPTSTGLAKVSAGSWVAAAATLVNTDVDAAAAIAGTKISPAFGAQAVSCTGVDINSAGTFLVGTSTSTAITVGKSGITTTNAGALTCTEAFTATASCAVGSSAATVGTVRVGDNNFSGNGLIECRIAGTNYAGLETLTSPSRQYWGDTAIGTYIRGASVNFLRSGAGLGTWDSTAGLTVFSTGGSATSLVCTKPIIGQVAETSPYGCHGGVSIAAATGSLTAAQYSLTEWVFTGTPGGTQTMTVPNPSTLAGAYWKLVRNACSDASSVVITTGSGATATITALSTALVLIENSNAYKLGLGLY